MELLSGTVKVLGECTIAKSAVILLTPLLLYMGLVRFLRYRRRDAFVRRVNIHHRRDFHKMTVAQAAQCYSDLDELEFPYIFYISVFFALFKTYGVPNISRTLAATSQLCGVAASKRVADTAVLISEFATRHIDSPRRSAAVARVNYLHRRYRLNGTIKEDDMLLTLSLFVLEPIRWCRRYEWRPLLDLEINALGIIWRDIGEMLEIDYSPLEKYYVDSYNDGLSWVRAVDAWSIEYETKHLDYAPSNEKIAKTTVDLLMHNTPRFLRPLQHQFFRTIVVPPLRRAIGMPDPHPVVTVLSKSIFAFRKFFIRNFALPRPESARFKQISEPDPKTGKAHYLQYEDLPWYGRSSFSDRWSPWKFVLRRFGYIFAGDDPKFQPKGYDIYETGPAHQLGKGKEEVLENQARLVQRRRLQKMEEDRLQSVAK